MILIPKKRLVSQAPLRFVGTTTEPATGDTFPVFVTRDGHYVTPDSGEFLKNDYCPCMFGGKWEKD
jgi:hypothetical protein